MISEGRAPQVPNKPNPSPWGERAKREGNRVALGSRGCVSNLKTENLKT